MLLFASCSSNQEKDSKEADAENCTNPNTDHPKPMALKMRSMYQQVEKMNSLLLAGKSIDSTDFPIPAFVDLEPTDSTVVTTIFKQKAENYNLAFSHLLESKGHDQKTAFNNLLQSCITCHQENCPGPIKKIRRLILP